MWGRVGGGTESAFEEETQMLCQALIIYHELPVPEPSVS